MNRSNICPEGRGTPTKKCHGGYLVKSRMGGPWAIITNVKGHIDFLVVCFRLSPTVYVISVLLDSHNVLFSINVHLIY